MLNYAKNVVYGCMEVYIKIDMDITVYVENEINHSVH
jgi:hypothetical protein